MVPATLRPPPPESTSDLETGPVLAGSEYKYEETNGRDISYAVLLERPILERLHQD